MDHLWSPWRYQYIRGEAKTEGCIFCTLPDLGDDRAALIVARAAHNYIVLNRFPYTSGHVMIVPYAHAATLAHTTPAALQEMMLLAQAAEQRIQQVYQPHGMNIGMNLGESAGAGVAGHIHLHVVPRWRGDANFLSTIGETRVLPEDLTVTWDRLHQAFLDLALQSS